MSQKTLLSFFKVNNTESKIKGDTTRPDKSNKDIRIEEDSPVKAVKTSNKRCRISSSESDSDGISDDHDKKDSFSKKTCMDNLDKFFKISSPVKPLEKICGDIVNEIFKEKEKFEIEPEKEAGKEKKEISIKFDEKKSYNPNVSCYDPIKNATWSKGQSVPYMALSRTLEELENVSARLKIIQILSNYLRSVLILTPNDFLPSVCLCCNKLGPAHENIELGLAEQTLIKAISQSTGRTVAQIRSECQELGDIGMVAEKSRASQKLMIQPPDLTVSGVYKKFREIATMSGTSSLNKKITAIQNLYINCKGPEAKFLIRSLNGKLRIGLAEQSVLQAIALACAMTPPGQDYPPKIINNSESKSTETFKSEVDELALILKTAYCECPNYELIIPILVKYGIKALPEHCKITPLLPIKPMLAHPTKGIDEVFTRFEGLEFTCEWKYDGERAQIHGAPDGTVKIFSRNQEDHTSKYPDIVSNINHVKKETVKSFILDCEVVAWDGANKRILPFQVLSTRKKKETSLSDIKVPVCLFMFDLLYLNDKPLVRETLFERRKLLRENFNQVEGEWIFANSIDSSKIEEVQEFLEESIKGNCEGLMVKTLKEESTYEIAKRSRNWLKLKKDYLDGVGDTIDVIVIGGYLGKGKRTGTYGGFLVACYDSVNDEYQSISKLGTGFSDQFLSSSTESFKPHLLDNVPSYYQFDAMLEPDHWFAPVQVWEIKCADMSLSPIHRAGIGLVDPGRGISLRFPRFIRTRDDKKPDEVTTTRQIIDLYNSQEQVKSQKRKKFNEEDFY